MAPTLSKFIGTERMPCEECWVTLAHDETSAVRALVLAKCLRRVVTTRKIVAVICDGVPETHRKLLQYHFDQCLKLDMPCEKNGTPLRFYAKVYCWSLPFMKKCVFLDYDAMVVKNCDDLFHRPGTAAFYTDNGTLETSVMVLEPSFDNYMELYKWLRSGKLHKIDGKNLDTQFGQWIMNRSGFNKLPNRYNVKINPGTDCSAWNLSDLCIIRFTGCHPMDTLTEFNIPEKEMPILQAALVKYWKETYLQEIMSIIQNPTEATPVRQKTNPMALPGIPQGILDANKEPIAIVGMSCRFPQADSLEEYWEALLNGKDCITKVPEHRWPSATSEDFREVQAGFLKCPVDEFDGKFFNMSPFELSSTDPQQRLLLEVSWEALEHAGINPQSLKGTNTGVFVGTWTQDYRDLIKNVNGEFSDFHRTYMGNSLGGTSGRLSFLLGLTGPNIASESGCSSGMVAVYLACESLRKHRSNIALAAGANLLLHPFQKRHMINVASPDGRCKTFDEKADGFGRAEGVATLVLKRYSDAVNDGDNILALIRGCGISQEGTSRSFGTPTKEVQEIAMQAALNDAGIDASDVSYVEAHGTGTVIGDTTEMAAITNLYCKNDRDDPLLVASGKTNIGHTESCSGIAGIIKVILSMQHQTIPPHINLQTLNPHININDIPIHIPTKPEKWETSREHPIRIAGISSFGITGTNSHLILQEPPKYAPPTIDLAIKDRPMHLITFSAKSEQSLDEVLESYSDYFQKSPDANLAEIAFTCNTGRAHFQYRVSTTASSTTELIQNLKSVGKNKTHTLEVRPEICFLFTGQGSQYFGMAKSLYETCPIFRMNFDKCSQILQEEYDLQLLPVLWRENNGQLHQSLYSQVSIFCIEYCLTEVWKSWGIKPDAVMGHSLGEFAAATCAGILSLEDALKLVATRSRLIEEKCPKGKMMAVKADKDFVDLLLQDFLKDHPEFSLDYAAFNSAQQTVIAGSEVAIIAFSEKLRKENSKIKTHVLDATNAFHSKDMECMLEEYEAVASTVTHRTPNCTFISGVTGDVLSNDEINPKYWVRHTRDPVQFSKASKAASELGYKVYLEIGPQPILCALKLANEDDSQDEHPRFLPSIRKNENEWSTMLGSLGKLYQLGFEIDWVRYDQFYNRKKCYLPHYPFQRRKHWYEVDDSRRGIVFNAKTVHPLLGCHIPNATSNSMFQATVDLEKFPYLKDHAIAGQIVFPAAGFLEICLSSGCLSTTGQLELINPMSVENLTVEAPLGLTYDEKCSVQTIVSREDIGDNKINIYSQKVGQTVKWVRQVTASFVPLQVNYKLDEEMDILQDIQSRCTEAVDTDAFYEKLTEVGLGFGENFKSLQKLWKSSNNSEILTEIKLPDQGKETEYITHPVALDALIQTIMIGLDRTMTSSHLYVPLVIGKTIVFSKSKSSSFYGHCSWERDQAPEMRSATLYDSDGKILAVMSQVQMVETTADAIVQNLSTNKLEMPNIYEEMWRSRAGPSKFRVDLSLMHDDNLFGEEFSNELAHCNELTSTYSDMVTNRRYLVANYVLKAFYELGWTPSSGMKINVDDLIADLNILPGLRKLINRYLLILEEDGFLKAISPGNWEMITVPPPLSKIIDDIKERVATIHNNPKETGDAKVTIGCGERLSSFLSGKESALNFLFPEDKTTQVCAETFYNESITVNAAHVALTSTVQKIMENYVKAPVEQRGVIRFLEVGAGTGSTTKRVLPVFDEFKAKYQYTFTDISPAFFVKAQPMFESYGQKIQYKVLNIEEDPLAQGFVPGHYDIVMASNVLHATRNLAESVRNVKSLLKEGGLLLMVETLQPIREYDVVFGLLDGFWRFDDHNIRPVYPTVSGETWAMVCKNEGYDRNRYFSCFGGQVGVVISRASKKSAEAIPKQLSPILEVKGWWIVFSDSKAFPKYLQPKFTNLHRRTILVTRGNEFSYNREQWTFQVRSKEKSDFANIFKAIETAKLKIEGVAYLWGLENEKNCDQIEITSGFLFLAQMLLSEFKGLPKFLLATEGMMPVTDSALDIEASTLWGMVRCFRTEHFNLHVRAVDLDPYEEDEQLKYNELFTEFWNDDLEFQVAYRQRSRHVCRLVQCKDFAVPLTLPNSDRFSLVLPKTKNIADLRFCPNGKPTLSGNEVDVEVRATGLNFRDVFVVLKPEKQFDSINCLGLEFAGVVVRTGPTAKNFKVGDRVMGCKFADGALPSHIFMDEDLLFKIPDTLTFAEAATIPAAFATAYYCLVMVAKLQKDETVLIHAGSGGVGLLAIQVARAVGANIIVTAGSRRKRTFLKNLGIKHIFHSRNATYCEEILKVTNGRGVDVVLNSLTSEGFKEATLKCCSPNARFVEMSKLHIWTTEEIKALRPDVDYTVVDLTTVNKTTWLSFWDAIDEYLHNCNLKPIPHTRFDAQHIREALLYLQKAKHIGKIIITMPRMIMKESRYEPEIELFNDNSTYLITGGLGGIGIELTKWMVKNGAKNIVLTSRRPPNENAKTAIETLNAEGNNIVAMPVDIGDYDQCKSLFEAIKDPSLRLSQLRGIFHAAGTLSDATYVNQSIETFQTAFQGKVYGAYNLHQLSQDCPLEFFTMFSSMVSILGPIGLSNYAAANAYIDALCHYRYSIGLCSQSINWGQWSEVGAAKDINMPAVKPFKPSQGLLALEAIMKTQKTQVAVLDVDFAYVRKLTSNVGTYLEELKITKGGQAVTFNAKIGNFWGDFNSTEGDSNKVGVIKSYIATILRQILKFDEDEVIDDNTDFQSLGIDSLMMVEMKNFLQTMLGKNITMNVSEMAELTTISKLSLHVMHLIQKSNETSSDVTCTDASNDGSFSPSLRKIIENDMILPDNIKGHGEACLPEVIKAVLITGATGKLGPYMLDAILKQASVEQVFCLIRAKDVAAAKEKLNRTLQERNLVIEDQTRIQCVPGDVTDTLLGLTGEFYRSLAVKVDAVVHCAVKANLMDPYVKSEESAKTQCQDNLRNVNVVGTKNILEFCGTLRTKRLLHCSTLLACQRVTEEDTLHEDFCDPSDVFEMVNVGYPVSKFIAEALCKQALDRGIPIQVHRLPALSGDKNGCFPFPNNHAMLRLLGFCKIGVVPMIPVPLQILPVDFAADISSKLFFNDKAPTGIFNVTNTKPTLLQDFPQLSLEFGFSIEPVEYQVFHEKLKENEEIASIVFPYREIDIVDDKYLDFTLSPVAMQSWSKNPDHFFNSRRVIEFIEDYEERTPLPLDILRKDMQYAKDNGIFSKMKLT